jgi:hypothetical protein
VFIKTILVRGKILSGGSVLWKIRVYVFAVGDLDLVAKVSPRYFTFRGGRVKGYGHAMEAVGGVHGGEGIGDR